MRWSTLLIALTACGRFGFSVNGNADDGSDATGADGATNGTDSALIDGISPSGWSVQASLPTSTTLWGVAALSATDVWVSGNAGTVEHFDGTWSPATTPATDTQLYFWAGATDDVWSVGRGCMAMHWAGSMWMQSMINACTTDLFAIGGVAGDLWAVGTSGTIQRWNGTTWTATPQGGKDLWAVWRISANDVWIVGSQGTLLHWDGAFSPDMSAPSTTITSIWGTPGDVWAVGMGGLIMRKLGAAAWTQITSPTAMTLYGVAGDSATNVWAVGAGGTILHYDGTMWTVSSSPTTLTLRNVQPVASGGFRAVGDTGMVIVHP